MNDPTAWELVRNGLAGIGAGTLLFWLAVGIGRLLRRHGEDDWSPSHVTHYPTPPVHEEIRMSDPTNHDPIEQALNEFMASITPLDKARASHPAGRNLKAVAAERATPPATAQAVITIAGIVLQNAIAARSLSTLTGRLHDAGLPVPVLTYRQASRVWVPFAVLVGAIAYRAHGAVAASRRQVRQVDELRARRRKIAADRIAAATKVTA